MRLLALVLASSTVGCAVSKPRSTPPAPPEVEADPKFLAQWAATGRFSLGRPNAIRITHDGRFVLFLRSGPRSYVQDLYELDTHTRTERVILTAEAILSGQEERLTLEEKARRERMRVTARGITSYQLSEDGAKILVPLSGRIFVVTRIDGSISELPVGSPAPLDPRFSPDGRSVAYVQNRDLFVIDIPDGNKKTRPRRLTRARTEHITCGLSEFVAQEEMRRYRGYWWSPDSRTIAYQEADTTEVETLHIADATHPERASQPWPYPRPGKANAKVRLGLVSVRGGRTTWVPWDVDRYPYLATVRWQKNAPLTLVVQNRTQTEEAVLTVDNRGRSRTLFVEKDEAWLNLDQEVPFWLDDASQFLWTTERDGQWRIEVRGADGNSPRTVETPWLVAGGIVDVNENDRTLVVAGGDEPTERHLFRVPLDPGSEGPTRLTEEPGIHDAIFSKDHGTWVHTATDTSEGPRMRVRHADGTFVGELRSVAEEPGFPLNLELTRVGESPAFHAAVVRPRSFQPTRRYPVIVAVYGGPHVQVVTNSRQRYVPQQWMADHGFIVVSLDGRGTPGRGRDWERAIRRNLIDLPLEDQVAGLRALGETYPEMDLSRVGIFGWSFGGYFSAMAVMRRPDVFHVGVAGAPVADWRDYDTHYTERYLGLPEDNPEGYERGSVLTWAKGLSRPLLIIHGTVDDNVYFTHSLKMSDALFRAGKPHDFLPLSGFTHMVPDPLVTERLHTRIMDYLRVHLVKQSEFGSK